MCQMAVKWTNIFHSNLPPKHNKIGIFGLRIYHLATLLPTAACHWQIGKLNLNQIPTFSFSSLLTRLPLFGSRETFWKSRLKNRLDSAIIIQEPISWRSMPCVLTWKSARETIHCAYLPKFINKKKYFKAFIFLEYAQSQCILSFDNSAAMCQDPNTLHPGRIRTQDLLFWRQTRWPLCHSAWAPCQNFPLTLEFRGARFVLI
jgi:hypothetical protein